LSSVVPLYVSGIFLLSQVKEKSAAEISTDEFWPQIQSDWIFQLDSKNHPPGRAKQFILEHIDEELRAQSGLDCKWHAFWKG